MAQTFNTPSERSTEKFTALFLFNLGGSGLGSTGLYLGDGSTGFQRAAWTSRPGHPSHGGCLDLLVLDLREAHGNGL